MAHGEPLTLAGPVLVRDDEGLGFPVLWGATTLVGLHEAANVFLGDSSTAAFQISS